MVRTRSRGHPNATACSAKAYCRAVDSRFSRTCFGEDCRTYTTASLSRCDGRIFAEPRCVDDVSSGVAGPPAGLFSADFMLHLLAVLRRLKLLCDDATENLERSLPILLGKGFPEALQTQPLTPSWFLRKKGPSWLSSMSLLLRCCCDTRGTN